MVLTRNLLVKFAIAIPSIFLPALAQGTCNEFVLGEKAGLEVSVTPYLNSNYLDQGSVLLRTERKSDIYGTMEDIVTVTKFAEWASPSPNTFRSSDDLPFQAQVLAFDILFLADREINSLTGSISHRDYGYKHIVPSESHKILAGEKGVHLQVHEIGYESKFEKNGVGIRRPIMNIGGGSTAPQVEKVFGRRGYQLRYIFVATEFTPDQIKALTESILNYYQLLRDR